MGRCSIIEYSDLPDALGGRRTPDGKLWIWAGSPAIHIFDVAFLKRMTSQGVRIPFHIARKKVPYLNQEGQLIQPETENALKFERFIFDLLPLAERCLLVETSRPEEFMPLKNGPGPILRKQFARRSATCTRVGWKKPAPSCRETKRATWPFPLKSVLYLPWTPKNWLSVCPPAGVSKAGKFY